MQIILNGQPFLIADHSAPKADDTQNHGKNRFSVAMLVAQRKLNPKQIAIEINQELVRREDYEQTLLADGDLVELVTLAGGG